MHALSHSRGGETSLQDDLQSPPPPPYTVEYTEPGPLSSSFDPTSWYTVNHDRLHIDLDSRASRALTRLYLTVPPPHAAESTPPPAYEPPARVLGGTFPIKLNIVVQIVGSRGDVQPFIALGTELQRHGHRVRIATHPAFEQFVCGSGLEFFSIGGDPEALMAYMVQNPNLMPSIATLRSGEIQRKRRMVAEMLRGCWKSCIEPDAISDQPFVADAIIANPPSFAHVHCAQALGVPVHLMFTMPWTSTTAFPHPLANIKNAGEDAGLVNKMSYHLVEWMTWQGLGDVVNEWRHGIGLEDVAMFDGPNLLESLAIPFTYCWSPALIPKPADWNHNLDVTGFLFRDAPEYTPPPELVEFIQNGSKPIYIGFGSIVLQDSNQMMKAILDAVRIAGARAIISKGWSKLDATNSEDIYLIGDCPHEWLFRHVAAVVHHGGAGTTACGLRNGRPTLIVPFFGDQPFWGDMVHSAGAGPPPVPHKEITAQDFAESIRFCLTPAAARAAQSIADKMAHESGAAAAVQSFHRHLPVDELRCDISTNEAATWQYCKGKKRVKLSKSTAEILLAQDPALSKHLKMYQSRELHMDTVRWDPVTGGSSAVMSTTVDLIACITGTFTKPVEAGMAQHRQNRAQVSNAVESDKLEAESSQHSSAVSVTSSKSTNTLKPRKSPTSAGVAAAGASAKSIAMFAPTAMKGMCVDIPLAFTEGLRAVPRLYGDTNTRDHGRVTSFRSGAVVAGKSFAWGFADGLRDVVEQPYLGTKKGGVMGGAVGLAKGAAGLVSKSGAGMFGLLAYPSQGISKSLRKTVYSSTRKAVELERHREGQWLLKQSGKVDEEERQRVITGFEQQLRRKD